MAWQTLRASSRCLSTVMSQPVELKISAALATANLAALGYSVELVLCCRRVSYQPVQTRQMRGSAANALAQQED